MEKNPKKTKNMYNLALVTPTSAMAAVHLVFLGAYQVMWLTIVIDMNLKNMFKISLQGIYYRDEEEISFSAFQWLAF